jgi:CelD/BcsL family acetyltransferase involved in cellulose biosynthesis
MLLEGEAKYVVVDAETVAGAVVSEAPAGYGCGVLEARVIESLPDAEEFSPEWDRLAVAAGLPYCAPAWMLAWWRHLGPVNSAPRIVAVLERGGLVGLMPWFLASTGARVPVLRMPCERFTTPIAPLAQQAREWEVAAAALAALTRRSDAPGAIVLRGMPGGSPWPQVFASAWPLRRGAVVHQDPSTPSVSPICGLNGDYQAWLAARTGHFRREAARRMRRAQERGAVMRRAAPNEVDRATAELMKVYRARWEARDHGVRTSTAVEATVRDAGRALPDPGRFWLWLLEADAAAVGAQLFVRAGTDMAAWGGGFLPEWSALGPSFMLAMAALEAAARDGVVRVDLGPGAASYKMACADAIARTDSITVFPRSRRYPAARAAMLPTQARASIGQLVARMPPLIREPIQTTNRRLRGY